MQFGGGSETQVLADWAMNEEETAVFRAVSRAMPAAVGDRRKNAARRKLQAQWSEQLGVVRINGARARWWNLVDGRAPRGTSGLQPPLGWPEEPPAWDHAEFWGREKKPFMAVSQPYPWALNRDIDCLDDFADEHGLRSGFRITLLGTFRGGAGSSNGFGTGMIRTTETETLHRLPISEETRTDS